MGLLLKSFIFAASLAAAFPSARAQAIPDPSEIVGFEILVAGSCGTSFVCYYGHSFLRLVSSVPANDLVLGFYANERNPSGLIQNIQFTAQGILGMRLGLGLLSFSKIFREYVIEDRRELIRLPLQVSPDVKIKLIKNLRELISTFQSRVPGTRGYDILFNNCAGKIVQLLSQSGVPTETFGIAIPLNLPAHLFRTYVAFYPPIRLSARDDFARAAEPLAAEFYQYCQTIECARVVVSEFSRYWQNQSIQFPLDQAVNSTLDDPETKRTLSSRTSPNHWNGNRSAISRHFELLRVAEAVPRN